jgi:uncharacterized DUF497 family protein
VRGEAFALAFFEVTIKQMGIEFDVAKSERNARERGLPFALVEQFDWDGALYIEDVRFTYPERRFVALGFIGDRLHVVCFTPTAGSVRVISFRKANSREIKRYEETAHE